MLNKLSLPWPVKSRSVWVQQPQTTNQQYKSDKVKVFSQDQQVDVVRYIRYIRGLCDVFLPLRIRSIRFPAYSLHSADMCGTWFSVIIMEKMMPVKCAVKCWHNGSGMAWCTWDTWRFSLFLWLIGHSFWGCDCNLLVLTFNSEPYDDLDVFIILSYLHFFWSLFPSPM